jgi:hypothetical protein
MFDMGLSQIYCNVPIMVTIEEIRVEGLDIFYFHSKDNSLKQSTPVQINGSCLRRLSSNLEEG